MKIAIYTLLILSIFFNSAHSQQLYNHDSPNSYRNQTWMSLVDDGFPIRSMNIMGTHQTMGYNDPFPWLVFQSQVQTLSDQLLSGIRAVDIRVFHQNNLFVT